MHHNFKNLIIWQKAIILVKQIYCITKDFPKEEKFGLVSQIRRSAVSIVSNIAEGAGRGSNKSFNNFLHYSIGSICELETQLIISQALHYIDRSTEEKLIQELSMIRKMIITFQKKNLQ